MRKFTDREQSLEVWRSTNIKKWQRKSICQGRHKVDQLEGKKYIRNQREVVNWMAHHTLLQQYHYSFSFFKKNPCPESWHKVLSFRFADISSGGTSFSYFFPPLLLLDLFLLNKVVSFHCCVPIMEHSLPNLGIMLILLWYKFKFLLTTPSAVCIGLQTSECPVILPKPSLFPSVNYWAFSSLKLVCFLFPVSFLV